MLHDIGRKRAALLDHRIKKVLEAALIRELRSSVDGVSSSETYGAKQGILGPQWQRPELYGTFYPAPGVSEAAE